MDKKTQGTVVLAVGAVIFVVAAILLAAGTTDMGLYLFWGALAIVGVIVAAIGNKMRNQRYE